MKNGFAVIYDFEEMLISWGKTKSEARKKAFDALYEFEDSAPPPPAMPCGHDLSGFAFGDKVDVIDGKVFNPKIIEYERTQKHLSPEEFMELGITGKLNHLFWKISEELLTNTHEK